MCVGLWGLDRGDPGQRPEAFTVEHVLSSVISLRRVVGFKRLFESVLTNEID